MENIWIKPKSDSDNKFWYVDYESHMAYGSNDKPVFESIKKHDGSIDEFLINKGFKIKSKYEDRIHF